MFVGSLSSNLRDVANVLSRRGTATGEGGLLSGVDPTAVNTSDPIRLWIIQLVVIVGTSQLLGLGLRKIKQPKVIAEVIGGIVLGPTLMGRVPGFTEHIFPEDSLPFLSLVANIGLVLFLFLVGLEIDASTIKRNARTSFIISLGAMCLPFSIGAGMSKLVYNQFVHPITPNTQFTHFMLFTCVAYSITAFPVLCRILTELKLLDTTVGICVLSAGVGNDIVGWTLLALSVALVNATTPLTALWIVFLAVAWALFLLIPVRWLFAIFARHTRSLDPETGPSSLFVTATMLLVFGSAWFTDVIGVHAIFGGFLAGLVVPRSGGLAIKMTEKVEDLVAGLFLPLYFTLSGLSTDLGLLNTGTIWGYTIAVIVTAWIGKFFGASIGARIAGFNTRESATIGTLMSCKGLVELIVLNVGLQAGILSTQVFSMFVLEALTLTFFTTPVVVAIYPPRVRVRVGPGLSRGNTTHSVNYGHGHIHGTVNSPVMNEKTLGSSSEVGRNEPQFINSTLTNAGATGFRFGTDSRRENDEWTMALKRRRFTVVLDKLEHLPGMICLAELLRAPSSLVPALSGSRHPIPSATTTITSRDGLDRSPPSPIQHQSRHSSSSELHISLSALRLIELSDRTSAVMKSSAIHSLVHTDPLLNIFRTVAELNGCSVHGRLEVVTGEGDGWAKCVSEQADEEGSDVVVVPWVGVGVGHIGENQSVITGATSSSAGHFEAFEFFKGGSGINSSTAGGSSSAPASSTTALSPGYSHPDLYVHSHFVRGVFTRAPPQVDVALYIDRWSGAQHDDSKTTTSSAFGLGKIFMPFFGGPDDRAALELVVQICLCTGMEGIVMRVVNGEVDPQRNEIEKPDPAYLGGNGTSMSGIPDTLYGNSTTTTRLQSHTADHIAWEQYSSPQSSSPYASALSHMTFTTLTTPQPLHTVIQRVSHEATSSTARQRRMLVVMGRSRRMTVQSHHRELKLAMETYGHLPSEVHKTVGDVASAVLLSGVKADMIVMQAGSAYSEND